MIETCPVSMIEPVDDGAPLVPGTLVTKPSHKGSIGTIVAVKNNGKEVVVLWSNEGVSPFAGFVFPAVTRLFGPLVAQDLVSIQPMTAPTGLVFYLDYTYGSGSK